MHSLTHLFHELTTFDSLKNQHFVVMGYRQTLEIEINENSN